MHFPDHWIEQHGVGAQVSLYAGCLIALWCFELCIGGHAIVAKWRHGGTNVALLGLTLPVQLIMTPVVVAAAAWTLSHHWGLLRVLPGSSSGWSRYLFAFVLLDLCDYLYHVTMHRVAWFWRFHLVHHSDPELDVSTTVREHPGETFIRVCFLAAWVFLLGATWKVLLLRQTVETISNLTSHSKHRLPDRLDRALGWLFITPNLHHAHHHFEQPFTDCNYGDVFSLWDRLFGTFVNLPANLTVFGIDSHPEPGGLAKVLGLPFRLRSIRQRSSLDTACPSILNGTEADLARRSPESVLRDRRLPSEAS